MRIASRWPAAVIAGDRDQRDEQRARAVEVAGDASKIAADQRQQRELDRDERAEERQRSRRARRSAREPATAAARRPPRVSCAGGSPASAPRDVRRARVSALISSTSTRSRARASSSRRAVPAAVGADAERDRQRGLGQRSGRAGRGRCRPATRLPRQRATSPSEQSSSIWSWISTNAPTAGSRRPAASARAAAAHADDDHQPRHARWA